MGLYLGLDLGTSWLKATIIDDSGRIVGKTAKEIHINTPKNGYAEEFPSEWWNTFCILLKKLAPQTDFSKIEAIGLSGQMHGLVCYNKQNEVLRQAVIWADKRSTSQVEQINDLIGYKRVYEITGNPIFTGFMLPSLLWLKENEPELYGQINQVSSPKDYIAYRLTGNIFCEPSDALATGCFDYSLNDWSKEILKTMKIDSRIFPQIIDTSAPYGKTTKEISELCGLPEGIPVYGGSDQSMAAMGCGLIEDGQSFLAISTGGQFLVISKDKKLDKERRLHTLNHALKDVTMNMAATLSAGLSLKWFKQSIMQQLDSSYDAFIQDIEEIPLGSDGLFYMPFLAGERTPYFNPHLKGAFIGTSLEHNRLHFIRAIMEGVAFSFRDGLETFKETGVEPKTIILSGGGTKNATWRQIITDVLNIPTQMINIEDHSPFGAAVFAKFALEEKINTSEGLKELQNFYKSVIKVSHKLKPSAENHKAYMQIFKTYKSHAKYLNDLYKQHG